VLVHCKLTQFHSPPSPHNSTPSRHATCCTCNKSTSICYMFVQQNVAQTRVGNRFTGVTATSCDQRLREQLQRHHGQAKKIHVQFRAFPTAPSARAKLSSHVTFTFKTNPFRSTLNMPHSIHIKIVCVRLPVATAIWRAIIHCY